MRAARMRMISALFFGSLVLCALHLPRAQAEVQEPSREELVIQVRSAVELEGTKSEITLGDLIVARESDDELLEVIRPLRLADAPSAGESRSFTGIGIEEAFRPHLAALEKKAGGRIVLRVPARITVVRKTFELRSADVEMAIKENLKRFCDECEFEITALNLPIIPLAQRVGGAWQIRMRDDMPRGNFSIPVEVTRADGVKNSYWITGNLSVRKSVPVSMRALQAGEKVQPEDFTMQVRDITFATDVAPAISDFEASNMARQIGAGQIIWKSSLRRELALKSGDAVKVTAGGDVWQITIEGVAQSSGYIGDQVRVKIPRTQKLVSGILRKKGVVEVQ
jgi:flagellar basal body P-ring formation protein FlgA